jgi:hypothetical protein
MPVKDIQRTLLDLIHTRIMEYVASKNMDRTIFEEVYEKIIGNDFLFEDKYMEPVSNTLYTAQVSFKFDYQNAGSGNDVFVELYKDGRLINKIKFCGIGWRAARGCIKYIEWIDENNVRLDNLDDGFLYWKINVDGTVELDSFQKSDYRNVFRLGIAYYYGKETAKNEEKGMVGVKAVLTRAQGGIPAMKKGLLFFILIVFICGALHADMMAELAKRGRDNPIRFIDGSPYVLYARDGYIYTDFGRTVLAGRQLSHIRYGRT